MKYLHFSNFWHQILIKNAIFATFPDIPEYLSKWIQQIWWISLQNIKSVICDLSQRCRPPPLKLSLFCAMGFPMTIYMGLLMQSAFLFYAMGFPMTIYMGLLMQSVFLFYAMGFPMTIYMGLLMPWVFPCKSDTLGAMDFPMQPAIMMLMMTILMMKMTMTTMTKMIMAIIMLRIFTIWGAATKI